MSQNPVGLHSLLQTGIALLFSFFSEIVLADEKALTVVVSAVNH
jgi:hypothetical protein